MSKSKHKAQDNLLTLPHGEFGKETATVISHVLSSMPQEVRDYIVKNVVFTDSRMHKEGSQVVAFCYSRKNFQAEYNITFDSIFYTYSKEYQHFVIAHEIGHAYLKHDDIDDNIAEKEAIQFASKYGFKEPEEQENGLIAELKQFYKESNWSGKLTVIFFFLSFLSIFLINFLDFIPDYIIIVFFLFCIVFGIFAGTKEYIDVRHTKKV